MRKSSSHLKKTAMRMSNVVDCTENVVTSGLSEGDTILTDQEKIVSHMYTNDIEYTLMHIPN